MHKRTGICIDINEAASAAPSQPQPDSVELRACPACSSSQYDLVGSSVPGFSIQIGTKTYRQPPYSIQQCAECGLLFKSCVPPHDELENYYNHFDFRNWEIAGYYPTEECVLSGLKTLPPGATILDFGCSSGRLLAALTTSHRCYGFEINPIAAAEAAQKGLQMLTPAEMQSMRSFFDAIVMVDVFEHLLSPLTELENLTSLLRLGGRLIIATGNGNADACRRDPAMFWYFSTLQHVCMITRDFAKFVEARLQLRLEEWVELSHYRFPLGKQIFQTVQHFAFWQFRRRTFLSKTLLPLLPWMRRARTWQMAPAYECSRDHVVAVFSKLRERPHPRPSSLTLPFGE